MDKAPSNYFSAIVEHFNIHKIKRIFIPGGLTRKLQPLDVEVNKPFKDYIKKILPNIKMIIIVILS